MALGRREFWFYLDPTQSAVEGRCQRSTYRVSWLHLTTKAGARPAGLYSISEGNPRGPRIRSCAHRKAHLVRLSALGAWFRDGKFC